MSSTASRPRAALIILDGFGHREAAPDNAVHLANAPTWKALWDNAPHTLIDASGEAVGLPAGQFGNSEVGHLNLGAGRVVYMDLTRIDQAIKTGELTQNPGLLAAIEAAITHGSTLHLMGLLSPGGVHSHERHWHSVIAMALALGVPSIACHAFLDGRDVPPKSASDSLATLQSICEASAGRVALYSVCGRYFAMDRDKRWERVEPAYRAIVLGKSERHYASAHAALMAAYEEGKTDEFVPATVLEAAKPLAQNDAAIFLNFRADRARELTEALCFPKFTGFARTLPPLSAFTCLSFYGDAYADPANMPVGHIAFRNALIEDSLGETLSKAGLTQLRLAETEKYAHVTYFFSGGREAVFEGETRRLIPSPKVATYDLQPQMSAPEVAQALVEAIKGDAHDVMICNFANGDMVGHTGDLKAAIAAVEALDTALATVITAAKDKGVPLLITADHGNCEQMFDPLSSQVHTQHTTNWVPLVYVGVDGQKRTLNSGGALKDVAPTLLALLRVAKPDKMSGESLFA